MKIPEWLPDTQHPVRAEQQPRKALIEPWMRPPVRFLHIEAAGGFVLLACTLLALIVANSPWSAVAQTCTPAFSNALSPVSEDLLPLVN